MGERMLDVEDMETEDQMDEAKKEYMEKTTQVPLSYKASLMGFKGMEFNGVVTDARISRKTLCLLICWIKSGSCQNLQKN